MKTRTEIAVLIVACAIVSFVALLAGCASCARDYKTYESDFTGGLDRKITLYDNGGNVMREWEGKIDVDDENGNIMFDLDGRRTIVSGGIVLVEEK